MNGEAVTKIAELARLRADGMIADIQNQYYSTRPLHRIAPHFPTPETLKTQTLTGFRELIATNNDGLALSDYFVHIADHMAVYLRSNLQQSPDNDQRAAPYAAMLPSIEHFRFNAYMDLETFIITLRSMTISTDDRENLLRYLSKVDEEESISTADDGITQSVVVKKGQSGAVMEAAELPATVVLQPFRTFPEVVQPESAFLFRLRKGLKGGIDCALFESDGGLWQYSAIQSISKWLVDNDIGVPIIA